MGLRRFRLGPTSKGRGREGTGGEGKGKGRKEEGRGMETEGKGRGVEGRDGKGICAVVAFPLKKPVTRGINGFILFWFSSKIRPNQLFKLV